MILKRQWGPPVSVSDAWNKAFTLARHRPYVYWSDNAFFPCDSYGFRASPPYPSFLERYEQNKDRKKVFCLGGSTTFGWYCRGIGTYPAFLQHYLNDTEVFNFGVGGLDLTSSLDILSFLLRNGNVPDQVLFVNGTNEKQGWLQATTEPQFMETFNQYLYFKEYIEKTTRWLPFARRKISFTANSNPFRFIANQMEIYVKAHVFAKKLLGNYGVTSYFFLEPNVWDVWKDSNEPRSEYIQSLYRSIEAQLGESVINLARKTRLLADHFLDWQHLSEAGNDVLAQDIVKEIK